jgi:hypothetical protein
MWLRSGCTSHKAEVYGYIHLPPIQPAHHPGRRPTLTGHSATTASCAR